MKISSWCLKILIQHLSSIRFPAGRVIPDH
nr:MAG TPA: hypothetical protein [Caudoviricetes sp.]